MIPPANGNAAAAVEDNFFSSEADVSVSAAACADGRRMEGIQRCTSRM